MAKLEVKLYSTEKVYLNADIVYDYNKPDEGEVSYGEAYIAINELFGEELSDFAVSGDIAEIIANAEELIAQATGLVNGVTNSITLYSEEGGEDTNGIANIIAGVLELSLDEFVSELVANSEDLRVTANVGAILSELGYDSYGIGEVSLVYDHKAGVLTGEGLYNAENKAGLNIAVSGTDEEIGIPEGYLDINVLIDSIQALLESKTIGVDLTLTGEALADLLAANNLIDLGESIDGLTLELEGDVNIGELLAKLEVKLYSTEKVYLNAEVVYDYNKPAAEGEVSYGEAYIAITTLLNKTCDIKLYGDIATAAESVQALLSSAENLSVLTGEDMSDIALLSYGDNNGGEGGSNAVADIIAKVLQINLVEFASEITSNISGLGATVNVDNILKHVLGEDYGYNVGNVKLSYEIARGENGDIIGGTLTGSALEGGLELKVSAPAAAIEMPDKGDYFNVNTLLTLINNAKTAVESIINSRSVYFDISNAEMTVDGVTVGIKGAGEASWSEEGGLESLALDLEMRVASSFDSEKKSSTSVEFIYNAAAGYNEPLVQLAVNGTGIIITQADIDGMESDITGLINIINSLLGNSEEVPDPDLTRNSSNLIATLSENEGEPSDEGQPDNDDYLSIIKFVLSIFDTEYEEGTVGNLLTDLIDGLYSDLLPVILEGDINVSENQLEVIIGDLTVTFGAGKNLTLKGSMENIAALDISVSVPEGEGLATELGAQFDDESKYTFYDGNGEGGFSRAIYEFIFGAFESVDIGSFLGGDTYSVEVTLNGGESGIEALAGIYVNAKLFFADGLESGNFTEGKLVEADLEVEADGFSFKAAVFFHDRTLYIDLLEINGTEFSDLKLKASTDNIYRAVENLISIVRNDKIMSLVSGLIGGGQTAETNSLSLEQIATYSGGDEGGEGDSVTDIISAVLSFNYAEIVNVSRNENSIVATLNIDKLLEELNIEQQVGTAKLEIIGGEYKSIKLTVVQGESSWLTIGAERAQSFGGISNSGNLEGYIDIGFVADMVEDVNKFLSSNRDEEGNISTLYTFYDASLTINLNLADIIDIDIVINEIYITVGFDDAGELYFSMSGDLQSTGFPDNLAATVDPGTIAVTYSNGYITLGRNIGDSDELYWVMTLDYFIDHLFAEDSGGSDSPIRWLTGLNVLSGIISWNTIANALADATGLVPEEVTYESVNVYEDVAQSTASNISALSGISLLSDPVEENKVSALEYFYKYISYFVANADGADYELGIKEDSLLSNLGMASITDAYAMAMNDTIIEELTGGALTTLDIGIVRNAVNGIGSLNAFTNVGDVLNVGLDLVYQPSVAPVTDYFDNAISAAKSIMGENYDFDEVVHTQTDKGYSIVTVGGVKVEDSNGDGELDYDYVETLKEGYYNIVILDSNDNELATYALKYGDTINFYDVNNALCYEGGSTSGKLIIYQYQGGNGEAYSSFTLNSGIAIPSDTEAENLTLTFKQVLIDYIYTDENGVEYTFVGSNDRDSRAHYAVTGLSDDSKYSSIIQSYYDGSVLVLANEIVAEDVNGNNTSFPVSEIAAGAFANTSNNSAYSLKNVVVPENITWVGGRAFLDNKDIQSIVFLAESVEFSNNRDYNPNGISFDGDYESKNFPFYGCGTDNSDKNTELRIYYNSTTSTDENIFCFNRETYWDWGTHTRYHLVGSSGGALYGAGTWTYIDGYTVVISDDDSKALAMDNEAILAGLSNTVFTSDVSADIADTVLENINNYTAEHYDYINGFKVSVSELTLSGRQTVTVTITNDMTNAWYLSVGDSTTTQYNGEIITLDITYEEGATAVVAGKTFVAPESEVIVSLNGDNANKYDLVSINGEDATENRVTLVFGSEFKIEPVIQEHVPTYVAVSSEKAFNYTVGETTFSAVPAGGNVYLVDERYVASGALPTAITSAEDYYYFLGWAQYAGNSYQFVTSATVAEDYEYKYASEFSETSPVTYYAIWAYNESQKLTSTYTVSNATSELPKAESGSVTAGEGSLYAWYSNKEFSGETIDSLSTSTIVYARLQFEFKFTVNYDGGTTMTYNGNGAYSPVNNSLTYTVKVYEGNKVAVSYSTEHTNDTIFGVAYNHRYTGVVYINVYESNSSNTAFDEHTLRVQSSDGNSGKWDRRLKTAAQGSVWTHAVEADGERITGGSDTISYVVGNIGLTYSV